jgi:putative acyl-CoA dehydrogenase
MASTHTVHNQAAPREGLNEYLVNRPLAEGVTTFGAGWATAELTATGELVGTAGFQHDAELANTVEPRLLTFDRWGNRLDEVEYHPAYHSIIGSAVAAGAHTAAWAAPRRAPPSSGSSPRSSPVMPARCR